MRNNNNNSDNEKANKYIRNKLFNEMEIKKRGVGFGNNAFGENIHLLINILSIKKKYI